MNENRYEKSGFKFDYSKKRLGKSKSILKDEIKKIDIGKRNYDDTPLFVNCKACECYMDFRKGLTGFLDGKWICQSCGASVRERTIYNQLEKESTEYINDFESDEIPEVCEECGGAWPECMSGCRLFRD